MELFDFLVENMYVLIPVLYFIGHLLKQAPKVADWLIPFIITILGIAFSIGINGFGVDAVIQGILVAGATVLGNEMYKQVKQKDEFKDGLQ